MVNTTIDLGHGLVLRTPVMTASGTFGYGEEYTDFVDLSQLGGIIVKGIHYHLFGRHTSPRGELNILIGFISWQTVFIEFTSITQNILGNIA